jgi:outer membrane lipoprotein carrier protein
MKLFFTALLAFVPAVAPSAPPELSAVLAALRKPKSVSAAFTQVKTMKAFKKPQEARGRVYIAKPAKLRLEYLEPYQTVLVVNGDQVTMSYPKLGQKQSFDKSQDPGMKAVFDTILFFVEADEAALEERFEFRLDGAEPRLFLTPKGGAGSVVTSIEVWIDVSRGVMSRLRLLEAKGGETDWRFDDVAVDTKLDEALFSP